MSDLVTSPLAAGGMWYSDGKLFNYNSYNQTAEEDKWSLETIMVGSKKDRKHSAARVGKVLFIYSYFIGLLFNKDLLKRFKGVC